MSIITKKVDLGAFTILCTIGMHKFEKQLYDLGASINLMTYSIYRKLGLVTPTTTIMWLLMVDLSIKRRVGIFLDVLVKVDYFIPLVDFVVIDYEIDQEVPVILGWPFLSTRRCIIDIELGEIRFWVNNYAFRVSNT